MTLVLEDLELELVDEIRCQSRHGADLTPDMLPYIPPGLPDNTRCSVVAVARKVTCQSDFFICQVSYEFNIALRARAGISACPFCGAPGTSCWRIYPI